MTGSDADWEEMTNKEMHDKFVTLVMANTEDVDKRLGEAIDKLAALEQSFDAKLDTKFNVLLACLPPPPPVPPPRPGYVGVHNVFHSSPARTRELLQMQWMPAMRVRTRTRGQAGDTKLLVVHAPTFAMLMLHHALRYGTMMIMLRN